MKTYRCVIAAASFLFWVVPCAADETDPLLVDSICDVFEPASEPSFPHSACQIHDDNKPFGSSLKSVPDPSISIELSCELWPHSYGSVTVLLEGRPTIVAFSLFVVPDPATCGQPGPLITSR